MARSPRKPEPRLFEVYVVTNLVNGKQYVGKTIRSAKSRWAQHCRDCGKGQSLFARAIHKYGPKAFEVSVLYRGVDEREIFAVEKAMIAQYGTYTPGGYNLTIGGDGPSGHKQSQSHREKTAASKRGRKFPNLSAALKGRVFSEEWRRNIGNGHRGKVISLECKIRMSAAHLARPKDPDIGAKISAGKLGKSTKLKGTKRPAHIIAKCVTTRKANLAANGPSEKMLSHLERMRACKAPSSKPVWCVETGQFWPDRRSCARSFGVTSATGLAPVIDTIKTYRGKHFVSKPSMAAVFVSDFGGRV